MSTPVALTITVLLLAGNAFFVGAEFAVTSSRRSQLEPLAEAGDALTTGPAAAPVVQICHKGPDRAGTCEKNR